MAGFQEVGFFVVVFVSQGCLRLHLVKIDIGERKLSDFTRGGSGTEVLFGHFCVFFVHLNAEIGEKCGNQVQPVFFIR